MGKLFGALWLFRKVTQIGIPTFSFFFFDILAITIHCVFWRKVRLFISFCQRSPSEQKKSSSRDISLACFSKKHAAYLHSFFLNARFLKLLVFCYAWSQRHLCHSSVALNLLFQRVFYYWTGMTCCRALYHNATERAMKLSSEPLNTVIAELLMIMCTLWMVSNFNPLTWFQVSSDLSCFKYISDLYIDIDTCASPTLFTMIHY